MSWILPQKFIDMQAIPFNQPHVTGSEWVHIQEAIAQGKLSANGSYTKKCQQFFESTFGFNKVYLTHSCTQALEMAALLLDLGPADEVIVPSFAYVSTANAFALRGCRLVFADSRLDYPGIDEVGIEKLITSRTKALVIVHYAGIACHMDPIVALCKRHGIYLIEDAAAALNGFYLNGDGKRLPLGSFGTLATFSFHETKNIACGEGGMLVVNDPDLLAKADTVWNRGTNRSDFERGLSTHYEWVSLGSAFGPSEINAAWLWAQLQKLEQIQKKRQEIWYWYQANLRRILPVFDGEFPSVPPFSQQNYHSFYLVEGSRAKREALIRYLHSKGIQSVSHYRCLHRSRYVSNRHTGAALVHAEKYQDRLLRLPFYADLDIAQLEQNLLSA
ncbi:dTDP-4-amino-4,6-dideoxygalactose transaminase [Cyclobacterium xiamenense]|uniref:dTDP-4-amino-4,6-dideoxygalactose transaminase n=1 Tax=Cyclobacterium xiamenense TaxID=1297121 RepID=A0A1H6XK11_9BACT|nr:dTDP-4-amino-4,6-dideoxygalactose transaminase [Cyclobacterium xiamenense]SEJ29428.1 dTDP-4-amino-4,6-dideoxygalactose transaminase [Cyclobacterium xiamenense]